MGKKGRRSQGFVFEQNCLKALTLASETFFAYNGLRVSAVEFLSGRDQTKHHCDFWLKAEITGCSKDIVVIPLEVTISWREKTLRSRGKWGRSRNGKIVLLHPSTAGDKERVIATAAAAAQGDRESLGRLLKRIWDALRSSRFAKEKGIFSA